MLSSILDTASTLKAIEFFYSLRSPSPTRGAILFLDRLQNLFQRSAHSKHRSDKLERNLHLHVTGDNGTGHLVSGAESIASNSTITVSAGRFNYDRLVNALGPIRERPSTVVYVCGPQEMTDKVVRILTEAEGMQKDFVLCEKWW